MKAPGFYDCGASSGSHDEWARQPLADSVRIFDTQLGFAHADEADKSYTMR